MPFNETVSWVLQIQGNLAAEVDKTAAEVKKLGLTAKETKAKIAELKDEQKVAAEASAVWSKNLLGAAGVITTAAIGIGMLTSAFAKWVSGVVEANKHLRDLGLNTGEAGRSVDAYSRSIDGLTTSFDGLLVKLSAPGFSRLAQIATVLGKMTGAASGAADYVGGVDPVAWGSAALNAAGHPLLASSLTAAGAGLDAFGQPVPVAVGMGDLKTVESTQFGARIPVAPKLPTTPYLQYSQRGIDALSGVSGRSMESLGYLPGMPAYGGIRNVVDRGVGVDTGIQISAAAGTLQAPTTEKTRKPITAEGVAGFLGSMGGGLGGVLSNFGPAGMVAGAVAGVVPHLGSTFHGITSEAGKLPEQLVSGITSILGQLPGVLSKTIPSIVTGLVGAIPTLIEALATSLPDIIKAALVDLPRALAEAIGEALGGPKDGARSVARGMANAGHAPRTRQAAADAFNAQVAMGGPGGQARSVHVHIHGGDHRATMTAIKKELGSYGSGWNLDPVVT